MNRVRQIAPLIILVVLAIAGASYAQLAANAPQVSKIAVINSQKAFETSRRGQKGPGPASGP